MDSKRIAITLATGNELVAEIYDDGSGFPLPISIFIQEKESGVILQDIAQISNNYSFIGDYCSPIQGEIQCLVWSDSKFEDYTKKFIITEAEQ